MIKYDDKMLQEINDNVDLLEYIGQFIDLKQRGKDYFGKCFKHQDTTPSFSINPENNFYYCHSCGIGGGIIGFLMDYDNLTFDEAVEKASMLADIDLSTMCHSETVKYLRKMNKNQQLDEVFEPQILDKSTLDQYDKEEITEWLEEGIRQEDLDLFEVKIDNKSNRIIYPVYDLQGNLLNIKARTRYKDYKIMKLPKYINYFKIGDMNYLQGLNVSIDDVKESGEIILFESIKSVMKLRKYGMKNAASVEKHSLTDSQIKLLIQLRVNIILAYDSDVSYSDKKIIENINILRKFTNVYVIDDKNELMGGIEAKNSPTDLTDEIWKKLYEEKRKII